MDFKSFGFDPQVIEGIEVMQYNEPTTVQKKVIPEIMKGRDIIACSQTGTGKTAAFLLPVINSIYTGKRQEKIRALVITPTRELAIQVAQQAEGFGYYTGLSSLAVYGGGGGEAFYNEKRALTRGVEIVVCTPGRMISHLVLGYADMTGLDFLILDEADRMLDMGFFDDIMKIISYIPEKRQTMLFSATMPPRIRELSRRILVKPSEVNIGLATPPDKIRQEAYVVYDNQKPLLLDHLVRDQRMKSILVFGETKTGVRQLAKNLRKQMMGVEEIHSDISQAEREKVMNSFRSKQVRILVATDIVSRGIDVEDIDLVVNFDVPNDAEDYVHRIGRTARAGSHGKACTFIGPAEHGRFAMIERLIGREVQKTDLPGDIGPGPEYKGAKGRHPSFFRAGKKRIKPGQKQDSKKGAGKAARDFKSGKKRR